jgi:hypothetical protein
MIPARLAERFPPGRESRGRGVRPVREAGNRIAPQYT